MDDAGEKGKKGFNKADKSIQKAAKSLGGVATKAAKVFGVAVAAATAASVKFAIDFESSFAGVRKTVDATEEQFAQLAQGMRDLATEIPVDVNQLNAIGEAAGQLGIETENIIEFTRVMAELGVTTNLSAEEAATTLARFANIMGTSQQDFERLGSTIVDLGNNFETTEAEITEMALRLSGAADQVGLAESEVLGIATALSSVGLRSEQAGTAFSKVFINIASAVESGGKELEQFAFVAGKSTEEFVQQFEVDAVGAVQEFVTGLGSVEERGISTIGVLNEMGITEVRLRDALLRASSAGVKFTEAIETGNKAWEENNALTKEAEQRFETTASQLRLLWNQVKDLGITLGSELLPYIKDTVDRARDWLEENEELIKQDIKGFVKGVVTAFRNLAIALENVPGLVVDIKDEMGPLQTAMAGVNETIILMTKGIKGLAQARLALSFLNPETAFHGEIRDQIRAEIDQLDRVIDEMEQNAKEGLMGEIAEPLGDASKVLQTELNPGLQVMNQELAQQKSTTVSFLPFQDKYAKVMEETADETEKAAEETANLASSGEEAEKAIEKAEKELQKMKNAEDSAIESFKESVDSLEQKNDMVFLTGEALIDYKVNIERAKLATEVFTTEGVEEARKQLARFRDELERKQAIEKFQNTLETIAEFDPFEQLEETTDDAKDSFDSLDDFVGEVAGNIEETFADALFAITKNIDDLEDVFKNALDAMLRSFLQFVAAIIANPIRIALDASLTGEGGGIGEFFEGIGDFFSGGFGAIKDIFSGNFEGFGGFLDLLGPAVGFLGTIGSIAFGVFDTVKGFFEDTPRLDIDFDSIKTEAGRVAATVEQLMDPELFSEIAEINVKRGGVGLGLGGDQGIKDAIHKVITGTIESIQSIIFKLPADLAEQLNQTLLSAEVDIETVVKGERLLEFDAKGKKIAEKFQAFIEGQLPAKVFAAIRESFFVPAFESLGVTSEAAQGLVDDYLADLQSAGSREERAAIGQEFIEEFNAFVDAFNIVEGNFVTGIEKSVRSMDMLAKNLGFEAIPSLEELRGELKKMIETADIDPEVIQKYVELRKAIVGMVTELSQSIQSTIATINSISSQFGLGVSATGAAEQAVAELEQFYEDNRDSLSLEERERILNEINSFNNTIAQGQIAEARRQAEAQAQAQRDRINRQIDQQRQLRDEVNETYDARLAQLEMELEFVQTMEGLQRSLIEDRRSLMTSAASPLSGAEQLNRITSEIGRLETDLAGAGTASEQEAIINQIRDLQNEAVTLAADVYGVGSAEQIAIYQQTVDRIDSLIELTDTQGRTSEDIQAEIEALNEERNAELRGIDSRIESLNSSLNSIGNRQIDATNAVSSEVRDRAQMVVDELRVILDEKMDMLGEVTSGSGEALNETMTSVEGLMENLVEATGAELDTQKSMLEVLNDIANTVSGAGGSGNTAPGVGEPSGSIPGSVGMADGGVITEHIRGIGVSGRRYEFGEEGIPELVTPLRGANRKEGDQETKVKVEVVLHDGIGLTPEGRKALSRDIQEGGLGKIIVKRTQRALNKRE